MSNSVESKQQGVSRRNFLLGAGIAGASIAAGLAGCSNGSASAEDKGETPKDDAVWDLETEVLVCGAGAAGTGAAYGAAESGAKVLLIEKAHLPGGSFARCAGGIAGAGSKVQKALGVEDSAEEYYQWIKHVASFTSNPCPDDYARDWAEHSGAQIDWLNELAEKYIGEPIFMAEWAEGFYNGLNDSLAPYEELGYPKEKRFARTHWATRHDDEANCGGPELADVIFTALDDFENYELRCDTAVKSLIKNEAGEVIGAIATDMTNGSEIRIKATKGVCLCCGGYPCSQEMKQAFSPWIADIEGYVCQECTGDGIRAAMSIGADITNMTTYEAGTAGYLYIYNSDYDDVFNIWLNKPGTTNTVEAQDPCICECNGGVVIDVETRVKDVFGETIPRLYAAGCDTGTNIHGDVISGINAASGGKTALNDTELGLSVHCGCGTYVGTGLYFGRKAGTNAASMEAWA